MNNFNSNRFLSNSWVYFQIFFKKLRAFRWGENVALRQNSFARWSECLFDDNQWYLNSMEFFHGRLQLSSARKKRNSQKRRASWSCHILQQFVHWGNYSSFLMMSNHLVIRFSLNNLIVAKPTQQIVYRKWKKFNRDIYVEARLNLLKENYPSRWWQCLEQLSSRRDNLGDFYPQKTRTMTTHRCPTFDDQLLSL